MAPFLVLLVALCARVAHSVRAGVHELAEELGRDLEEQKSNISVCAGVSQEVVRTHQRCSASLREPGVLQRFPSIGQDWCDKQLREIASRLCESEEEDRLRTAAMVEVSFERVTTLIGTPEAALISQEAWESCSSRQHSCLECESRFAGARQYLATSHLCEWREGACARAGRAHLRPWREAAAACGEEPAGSSYLALGSNRTGAPKKIALLVGVTYTGGNMLPGTYVDIKNVFRLLTEKKGFDAGSIFVLYDEGNAADFVDAQGKQAVILPQSKWARRWRGYSGTAAKFWEMAYKVVGESGLGAGDFFFFYFSGHGVQSAPGSAPDELDTRDEWLIAPSMEAIKDDDFYRFLVAMPAGVSVTAVADACHSEGFSDLPLNYLPGRMSYADLQGLNLETFDVQREWCADLLKAPEAGLPRARIAFISGSQNHQTSADLGELGGAFTSYALAHWTEKSDERADEVSLSRMLRWMMGTRKGYDGGGGWDRGTKSSLFNRFRSMLTHFKHKGYKQEPNVCTWPSVADQLDFDPFAPPASPYGTPDYAITFHPFAGGPRPSATAKMIVPSLCKHGGRAERAEVAENALLADEEMGVAEGTLRIRDKLRIAALPYQEGEAWEGWGAYYEVRLPPSKGAVDHGLTLSQTAPDVVSYVAPSSRGEHAGVQVGDIIRSVDGKDFAGLGAFAKQNALRAAKLLEVVGTRG